MIKVYLSLGVIAGTALLSSWATYQVVTGKQAKQEVKIITKEVENHNEDIISLQEHTRKIEKLEADLKKANARIPLVDNSVDCPVSEFERMWNEARQNANHLSVSN